MLRVSGRSARTRPLPYGQAISLKRIRRHAATRWSWMVATVCTVALPLFPTPLRAGTPPIDLNRGLAAGLKQALTPEELKQVEQAEAKRNVQPDVRVMSRSEMKAYRGGQGGGGGTVGVGVGGGGTGGTPSTYRNKYLCGVFPWQRSLRDVNLCNGNLFKSFTDIQVAPARGAGLALQRTYNSCDDRIGPFGIGWTHAYDIRMEAAAADAGTTDYTNYSPRTDFFGGKSNYHRDADGLYSPPAYLYDEMSSEYDAFLVDGPTKPLTDQEIGMDGTVKHFFLNGSGGAAGTERACDTITDRYGNQTVLAYAQTITLADGSTKKVLTSVTDPSGRSLTFAWTNLGTQQQPAYRITSVTGPLYSVTYAYNNADYNLSSVTLDPGGLNRTTTFGYTTFSVQGQNGTATGLLSSITDPLNHSISYSYMLGPLGAVWVQTVTEPAATGNGATQVWTITATVGSGSVPLGVNATSNGGIGISLAVDPQLRKRWMSVGGVYMWLTDYDSFNNVSFSRTGGGIKYSDPYSYYQAAPAVEHYATYGPHGNILTDSVYSNPSLAHTTYTYYDGSQYFQKASVTDATGHTTTIGVGSKTDTNVGNRGSVLWVRDARYGTTGAQFSYTYNAYGQKTSEINLNNVETDYTYGDQWGNLTQVVQDPGTGTHLARTTTMVYDSGGRVTSSTDPMARTDYFTYNTLGQPLTASFPATANTAAETVYYVYDTNGRILSVQDNRSATPTYMNYLNGTDVVSSVVDPITGGVGYTYGTAGQRLTMSLPGGGTWTYDYTNHTGQSPTMCPKDG